MKVIHALNHFLPFQTAGTEVYTWALIKQLQKQNIRSKVVTPHYQSKNADAYVYDGIEVFRYPEPSIVDRSLILGLRTPEGLSGFAAFIKNERPDIVHFHELAGSNGLSLSHIEAAKQYGAKIIMTLHVAKYTCRTGTLMLHDQTACDGKMDVSKCSACYLQMRGNSFLNQILLPSSALLYGLGIDTTVSRTRLGTALGSHYLIKKWHQQFSKLVHLCDKLVVISEWYKKVLLINGVPENKIEFIPQILPHGITNIKRKKKVEDKIKLIFIGRISPFKGLHLLIEAMAELPDEKISLDIYGQPTDSEYETDLRKKTIHTKNINWKGKIDTHKVVETMMQYDALCLCSMLAEMSPLVIQEAFAAGIPVIASDVYGNAEHIVHDFSGLLFKFNSVDSLKVQLKRCIKDEKLLYQLQQNITAPESSSSAIMRYSNLYNRIVS